MMMVINKKGTISVERAEQSIRTTVGNLVIDSECLRYMHNNLKYVLVLLAAGTILKERT